MATSWFGWRGETHSNGEGAAGEDADVDADEALIAEQKASVEYRDLYKRYGAISNREIAQVEGINPTEFAKDVFKAQEEGSMTGEEVWQWIRPQITDKANAAKVSNVFNGPNGRYHELIGEPMHLLIFEDKGASPGVVKSAPTYWALRALQDNSELRDLVNKGTPGANAVSVSQNYLDTSHPRYFLRRA